MYWKIKVTKMKKSKSKIDSIGMKMCDKAFGIQTKNAWEYRVVQLLEEF